VGEWAGEVVDAPVGLVVEKHDIGSGGERSKVLEFGRETVLEHEPVGGKVDSESSLP
jgi:hypothetical protein